MCEKEYEIGHKNKSIYCGTPLEERIELQKQINEYLPENPPAQ